jgi:hypothetical protein
VVKPTNNMPPIKLGQGEYEREDWCDGNCPVLMCMLVFGVVVLVLANL